MLRGQGMGLEIWLLRFQVQLLPPARFVQGGPWFNSLAMLV